MTTHTWLLNKVLQTQKITVKNVRPVHIRITHTGGNNNSRSICNKNAYLNTDVNILSAIFEYNTHDRFLIVCFTKHIYNNNTVGSA